MPCFYVAQMESTDRSRRKITFPLSYVAVLKFMNDINFAKYRHIQ